MSDWFYGADAQGSDGDEAAEAEETFRMGLQRNILHLSNVVRAQQDELVTLRAQLRKQDDQQKCLEDKIKLYQARAKAQPSPPPATDFGRSQRFMRYGQLAVMAGRLTGGSRPAACQKTGTPKAGVEEQAKGSVATVAAGESQTMRHLLGVNRDLRSQLARAEKQAEAFLQFSGRINLLEEEKRQLQSRLELMADQLKLQAAPLAALQLELNQARLDTESMRTRLREDRKDARHRQEDTEKKQSKVDELTKDLRIDLEEAQRAYQRESNKVDKYIALYNKAMSETERVTNQLEQSTTDARTMAHELIRMKNEIEQRSRRPHASTQTSPTSDEESGDNAPSSAPSSAESPKGDEISGTAEKEGEIGQETKSSINTEAQVVSLKAQLTQRRKYEESAEQASRLNQLQERLEDAERATAEALDGEERVKTELVHMKHEKAELVATAETSGARQEDLRTDVDEGIKKRRLSTMRAELCRTIDEMRSAEDAVKVSLTCLSCTRLFRNPHILTPCGHTLCGDCCDRDDEGFDEGVPKKGTERGAPLDGQGDSMRRVKASCCLCENEGDGAEGQLRSGALSQWTMAPNRAVAALVGKFTFRRQCLEVLSRIGQALWEGAVAPARSSA